MKGGREGTEERDLAAHEEHEEGDRRPEHLLAELDLTLGFRHLRHEAAEGLHELEKFDCKQAGGLTPAKGGKDSATHFPWRERPRRRSTQHGLRHETTTGMKSERMKRQA